MRYIEIAKTIKELARNIPQLLSLEGGYKMPSLKDLAKECGVSVATVSKALNNQPDIAPATRERIRAAARSERCTRKSTLLRLCSVKQ